MADSHSFAWLITRRNHASRVVPNSSGVCRPSRRGRRGDGAPTHGELAQLTAATQPRSFHIS